MVAFGRSEIWVWQLCSDFVNYLNFGFYWYITTGKQQYMPCSLPGIAYPFKLKGGVPCTYVNKKVGQPCGIVENLRGKLDRQIIKQLRRYLNLCVICCLKLLCLNSASLAVHSNAIRELQIIH